MAKKKVREYGIIDDLQKAMTFSLSSNMGRCAVSIANISSDLLILLADPRNKIRLLKKLYFLYAIYEKVDVDFFIGDRRNCEDFTTYRFFINSLSKTKVSLTLIDGEEPEGFVIGEELTKVERESLEKEDLKDLMRGLEEMFDKNSKCNWRCVPKTRWNKSKYKEVKENEGEED